MGVRTEIASRKDNLLGNRKEKKIKEAQQRFDGKNEMIWTFSVKFVEIQNILSVFSEKSQKSLLSFSEFSLNTENFHFTIL
jgi:hypothetical protein